MFEARGICRLWVCLYFPSSDQHVLFVSIGWFVRWEVNDCTVSECVALRIYSKQHSASLCSSYLAFSSSVSLKSKCGDHSIAQTMFHLVTIPVIHNCLEKVITIQSSNLEPAHSMQRSKTLSFFFGNKKNLFFFFFFFCLFVLLSFDSMLLIIRYFIDFFCSCYRFHF